MMWRRLSKFTWLVPYKVQFLLVPAVSLLLLPKFGVYTTDLKVILLRFFWFGQSHCDLNTFFFHKKKNFTFMWSMLCCQKWYNRQPTTFLLHSHWTFPIWDFFFTFNSGHRSFINMQIIFCVCVLIHFYWLVVADDDDHWQELVRYKVTFCCWNMKRE